MRREENIQTSFHCSNKAGDCFENGETWVAASVKS